MLNIYRVTNKVTHARMVCAARTPAEAIRMHPTCPTARWAGSWWVRHVGGTFGRDAFIAPPEGWTSRLELLHADEIGRGTELADAIVEAFEQSTDRRRGGENQEGPDSTWGGYQLSDLDPPTPGLDLRGWPRP